MTKSQTLSLTLAALATTLCLLGCQKDTNTVKDDPKTIAADAATSNNQPNSIPAAGQGQMADALNNPNTPPEVKAKIRAQMGGGR